MTNDTLTNNDTAARTRTYQYFNDRVFEGKGHREMAELFAQKVRKLYGIELEIMESDSQTDVIMDKLPDDIWFEWFHEFMEAHGVKAYD